MHFETIDIVGATGAVGRELLALLSERGVKAGSVRAFASERSAGSSLPFGSAEVRADALDLGTYRPSSLVLLACDAELSKRVVECASGTAELIVDNSSAFRDDPDVPLVIPELLGQQEAAELRSAPLVASPNCSAIQLALVLDPLERTYGLESVDVATYQAVSGAGRKALHELEKQIEDAARGAPLHAEVFPHPIACNVFPHESDLDAVTGWSVEEQKLRDETRRLLGAPELSLAPSCVRVPVLRAHAQAVHVTLRAPAQRSAVHSTLVSAPGLSVTADAPTPQEATGGSDVLVGRIRQLSGDPNEPSHRFAVWTACDQLRKGAALNVVQIAELHDG